MVRGSAFTRSEAPLNPRFSLRHGARPAAPPFHPDSRTAVSPPRPCIPSGADLGAAPIPFVRPDIQTPISGPAPHSPRTLVLPGATAAARPLAPSKHRMSQALASLKTFFGPRFPISHL